MESCDWMIDIDAYEAARMPCSDSPTRLSKTRASPERNPRTHARARANSSIHPFVCSLRLGSARLQAPTTDASHSRTRSCFGGSERAAREVRRRRGEVVSDERLDESGIDCAVCMCGMLHHHPPRGCPAADSWSPARV